VALNIRPTDALIQRLLQHSNASKPAHVTPPQSQAIADQVNISTQARQASQTTPNTPQNDVSTGAQSTSKQASLEDRILRMYAQANQRHEPES